MEDKSGAMPLSEGLSYLIAMFPYVDREIILCVLDKNNNRLEETIEDLLNFQTTEINKNRNMDLNQKNNNSFDQNKTNEFFDNKEYSISFNHPNKNEIYKSDSDKSKSSSCKLNVNDNSSSSDKESNDMEIDSCMKLDKSNFPRSEINNSSQIVLNESYANYNPNETFESTTTSSAKDYNQTIKKYYKEKPNNFLKKNFNKDTSEKNNYKIINYNTNSKMGISKYNFINDIPENEIYKYKNTYTKKMKSKRSLKSTKFLYAIFFYYLN